MKKINKLIVLSAALFFMAACDDGFDKINTDPQAILTVSDPGLLFTNALRNTNTFGNWQGESTIVQQFVLPYNLGTTAGYQFNQNVDSENSAPFNVYTGNTRTIQVLIDYVKDNPARTNLYNMARIWKALHFMNLVDHYGDIPYSEASKGSTAAIFYPKYDKGSAVYDDLYKELKEATAALDPAKDNNSRFDIFVAAGGATATEITLWKRLGYSIMLRLGMRYSKLDQTKAKTIVQDAFAGGVMQSNADNAVVANMTGTSASPVPITGYTNGRNGIRGTNPFNYYLAEPFVNQLKSTLDPRMKFICAKYPDPGTSPGNTNPDVTFANQFGFPIGYDASTKLPPGYRGAQGAGINYSQLHWNITGNTTTPQIVISYAQVSLMLAEAAFRGWLTGGLTAQTYYQNGITASMDSYTVYPNTVPITTAEKTAYLAQVGVAYDPTNALKQINTQYWIECFNNGAEAWANWRRSGFPALSPNTYDNSLNGGFIRRYSYPLGEHTNNGANWNDAVANLGGPDFLTTRIFWDIP